MLMLTDRPHHSCDFSFKRSSLNARKEFCSIVVHKFLYNPFLNDLVKTDLGVSSPQVKPGLPGFMPQVVCHFSC